jgi:hypothetical protein
VLAALRWPVWTAYRDGVARSAPGPARDEFLRSVGGRGVAVVLWGAFGLLTLGVLAPVFAGLVRVLTGLAAAAAGWWLKYLILTQAATNQGFAVPELPGHGAAKAATAATAAAPPVGEGT